MNTSAFVHQADHVQPQYEKSKLKAQDQYAHEIKRQGQQVGNKSEGNQYLNFNLNR